MIIRAWFKECTHQPSNGQSYFGDGKVSLKIENKYWDHYWKYSLLNVTKFVFSLLMITIFLYIYFRLAKVQENTIASLRNAASHVSEPLFKQLWTGGP